MVPAIRLLARQYQAMRWSKETRPVWIVALAVFVIGLFVFFALQRDTKLEISNGEAVAAALANEDVAGWLDENSATRAEVIPLDRENARVSFFAGQKIVAEVAVSPDAKVFATQFIGDDYIRAGNGSIQAWWVLALGALFFLALLLRRPLLNVRNADLVAIIATTLTIWTVNSAYFGWTMILGVALMAYLLARCLMVAAGPVSTETEPEFAVRFGGAERKVLGLIAFACAALAVMTTIPGGTVGDVSQASMSGATQILEGNIPYGNIMDGIVHGDTYPIFAYVLYAPAALIWPVNDLFDNLDGGLWIAAIAFLAGAFALFRAGRDAADESFGLRHAAAWLIFPPAIIAASAGSNDLPTAALVAWAIATWAHAGRTSTWLSAAAWAKVVPVFALPLWIARFRGAELRRALIPPFALTALMLILLFSLGGISGVEKMLEAIAFQSDRGAQLSFWVVINAPTLQVIVQAAGFALAAASAVAVWKFDALGSSLVRVSALAAAVLLVFQIGASYWSYAYLPWVYPLLAVALLWPSSSAGPRR